MARISDRFLSDVSTPDPVSVADLAAVLHFFREHAPLREVDCRWCREDAAVMVSLLRRRQLFEGRKAS